MAVTVTVMDLQQPTGELTESLFPGSNFDGLLAGWLAQATEKAEGNSAIAAANHDAAAAAWVYHRAYSHVAQRLASSPIRVSTSVDGSVAKEMTKDQREHFITLAQSWLDSYDAYIVPAGPVSSVFAGSQSVSTLARW